MTYAEWLRKCIDEYIPEYLTSENPPSLYICIFLEWYYKTNKGYIAYTKKLKHAVKNKLRGHRVLEYVNIIGNKGRIEFLERLYTANKRRSK